MEKKSLIVFDIDGTLTDSVIYHQKAFSETLLDIGVSGITSTFTTFKHHTDSFIAKEIYEKDRNEPFSEEKNLQFEKGLSDRISTLSFEEIKGAKALIEQLQEDSEYGVCYATGSLRKPAEHKLNSIGIDFEEWQLVASDQIFERENIVKAAIINSLANHEVEKFERVISVGDGLWDLLTAENLNIEFIGVGAKNRDALIQKGAKIVLDDLRTFNQHI